MINKFLPLFSLSVRSVDGTATSNGPNADYVRLKPTTLTFGPKDNSRPVTVTIIDDKLDEKPDIEAFTLVLSNNDKRVMISRKTFTVRIKDNDGEFCCLWFERSKSACEFHSLNHLFLNKIDLNFPLSFTQDT